MKTKFNDVPLGVILAVFLLILLGFSFLSVKEVEASERSMRSIGTFKLTWYCPCRKCSGSYGHRTSSGATATEGRTIAVDTKVIPYGTHVYIEGYGEFVAEDTGGKWVQGNHIDIFLEDHGTCLDSNHGTKRREVFVVE